MYLRNSDSNIIRNTTYGFITDFDATDWYIFMEGRIESIIPGSRYPLGVYGCYSRGIAGAQLGLSAYDTIDAGATPVWEMPLALMNFYKSWRRYRAS